jgi:hypothetical protein
MLLCCTNIEEMYGTLHDTGNAWRKMLERRTHDVERNTKKARATRHARKSWLSGILEN